MASLCTLATMAWALVVLGSFAGGQVLLDHDRIFAANPPSAARYAGFAAAWLVMVVAMMLPTAMVEIARARCVLRARGLAAWLTGYLGVWEVLGLGFLFADGCVHAAFNANLGLQRNDYLISAGVLMLVAIGETHCALRRTFRFARPGDEDSPRIAPFVRGLRLGRRGMMMCGPIMLFMMAASMHDLGWLVLLTATGMYQQVGRGGGWIACGLAVVALATAGYAFIGHVAVL